MAQGRLVILSGPSGVGKDTVIDEWIKVNPLVERVVARTTRPPREGEVDGVDYGFLTTDDFLRLVSEDHFLEYKKVYENFYGTPASEVERILEDGRIALLKIDVQGALAVMPLRPDAITVFLMPPSDEVLRSRLTGRGTDAEDVVERRLLNARAEMDEADKYQHRIVNEEISEVVRRLQEITGQ